MSGDFVDGVFIDDGPSVFSFLGDRGFVGKGDSFILERLSEILGDVTGIQPAPKFRPAVEQQFLLPACDGRQPLSPCEFGACLEMAQHSLNKPGLLQVPDGDPYILNLTCVKTMSGQGPEQFIGLGFLPPQL